MQFHESENSSRHSVQFFKFIEKPYDEKDLKSCIDEQIKKHRSCDNDSQIEQLYKFQARNDPSDFHFRNEIEKLIA